MLLYIAVTYNLYTQEGNLYLYLEHMKESKLVAQKV